MSTETITQTQTVADSATDWNTTLGFQQFDPNLGSLQAVGLSLTSDVGGTVSIENLQPDAVTSSVAIYGVVEATTPSYEVSIAAEPTTASGPEELGAYSGTIDFAGTSGTVVSGLTQVATASTLQTVSADPGPFVGTGTVPVTVSGQASVEEIGPANLEMLSQTTAGAQVTLEYQYGTAAPGGGGGFGGKRRPVHTIRPRSHSCRTSRSPPRRRHSSCRIPLPIGRQCFRRFSSIPLSARWKR